MSEKQSGTTKVSKIIRLMGNAIMVIAIMFLLLMGLAYLFQSPSAGDHTRYTHPKGEVK
jgi:hypothetical protein